MSIAQVVGRFYFLFFTFLPAQKSNKKRPPKSNTARFRETALLICCAPVVWAFVMLFKVVFWFRMFANDYRSKYFI